MDSHSTDELLKILNNINTPERLGDFTEIAGIQAFGSFSEYITHHMKIAGITPGELIAKSNIPRTYGYQLLDGRKNPGRDKVLALCLALSMELPDTQRALTLAGHSVLYPRRRRDSILIFSINRHLAVSETNELLYEMKESILE